jgi:acyl-CoA thioesterase FadM
MSRVKIQFPEHNRLGLVIIPVRISDINYGNHVGNDAILSIIHEARMQVLAQNDYTEMNAGGNSMIMADVMIAYKAEAFYGDTLEVEIYAADITGVRFDLLYRISTMRAGKKIEVAHAKTGMVCFDYKNRNVTPMTPLLEQYLNRR